MLERLAEPNALVLAVAWLFVLGHVFRVWPTLATSFGDTDDVMRLVEVRDLLAGQGWFDLHQYRLDPPAGEPMHWSRLIDGAIAGLIRLAGLFVAAPTAEKVAMALWPPLTLLPALIAVRALAVRLGGRFAALPALYLFVTCPPLIGQFVPGRIDHHNLQIALTFVLLAIVVAPNGRARAVAAGVVMALMLAIGMETLPFLLIVAAGLALHWVIDPDRAEATTLWGLTLAIATPLVAVLVLPPAEWLRGACDGLSAGYLGLAWVGGLGLAVATRLAGPSPRARLLALGLVAVLALVAFAWPEPRCLAGPFAGVRADVRAIWLDHVTEVAPWPTYLRDHPVQALLAVWLPLLALPAAVVLMRRPDDRRDPARWTVLAVAAVALAVGFVQIRGLVYAELAGGVLVAGAIARLAADARASGRSAIVLVLAGTILASTAFVGQIALRLTPASWQGEEVAVMSSQPAAANATNAAAADPCLSLEHFRALASLPPGLVAAPIDLGPSILAATPHSVVSAPYHRMQRGIVDAHHMLFDPPDAAIAALDDRSVGWVVVCTASKSTRKQLAATPAALLARLLAGDLGDRFTEVPGDPVVRVFRLTPPTAVAALTPR